MNTDTDPRAIFTQFISDWINGLNSEPEPAIELQRFGVCEAVEAARSAVNSRDAASRLSVWFTDCLTVNPGVQGPFSGLAYNLLSQSLDMVDWDRIAGDLRSQA